ncbi:MAG: patatin family protein [Lachnospiraceae bacterium]|nr:patatin family protein [Lachnospiraceae bacterium]
MKTGLVLEGGAMRGIFTAGVLDVFMDNNITFDGIIGVSAGAIFGVNLLSRQRGRVIRYNKRFNSDRRYMGIHPLLKTGNIVDTEYAYCRVPRELDVFDDVAFMNSGIPFYAVVTNVETGEPEYIHIKSVFEQMDSLRASASMPFVSKPVSIGGKLYLDGAVADSIPFRKFGEMGYDRLVVVLTKDIHYVKEPVSPLLSKTFYRRRFPRFEEKVRNRHIMYNDTVKELKSLEKKGEVLVIRPSENYRISRMEKDSGRLQGMYDLGLKDANACMGKVKDYINAETAVKQGNYTK